MTFWLRGQTKHLPGDIITNCTSCSCLVTEIEEMSEKRVNYYLSLYKTNPCLQRLNKLLTVLYIRNTLPSDTGNYSFQYADDDGRTLPLATEREMYNLTVEGKKYGT